MAAAVLEMHQNRKKEVAEVWEAVYEEDRRAHEEFLELRYRLSEIEKQVNEIHDMFYSETVMADFAGDTAAFAARCAEIEKAIQNSKLNAQIRRELEKLINKDGSINWAYYDELMATDPTLVTDAQYEVLAYLMYIATDEQLEEMMNHAMITGSVEDLNTKFPGQYPGLDQDWGNHWAVLSPVFVEAVNRFAAAATVVFAATLDDETQPVPKQIQAEVKALLQRAAVLLTAVSFAGQPMLSSWEHADEYTFTLESTTDARGNPVYTLSFHNDEHEAQIFAYGTGEFGDSNINGVLLDFLKGQAAGGTFDAAKAACMYFLGFIPGIGDVLSFVDAAEGVSSGITLATEAGNLAGTAVSLKETMQALGISGIVIANGDGTVTIIFSHIDKGDLWIKIQVYNQTMGTNITMEELLAAYNQEEGSKPEILDSFVGFYKDALGGEGFIDNTKKWSDYKAELVVSHRSENFKKDHPDLAAILFEYLTPEQLEIVAKYIS